MSPQTLEATANAMVADGKGILAIDESSPTVKKRFDTIGVESNEENRRAYRELLIACDGLNEFVSGMILFDETIRQSASDGTPFPELLASRGIFPGIKVDGGAKDLAGHPGEKVTEGLDKLRERLAEYRELGAPFAKWRAVITIGDGIPSQGCITANAHALARYAALCQEAGIVPMVEPEVMLDGNHSIERCYEASEATLRALFAALYEQRVLLEGTILKASMVLSGKDAAKRAGVDEVAEQTIRCLRQSVPAALAGVVFLSGGQTPREATAHLNTMNAMGANLPWKLSFSYSRALQEPALKAWGGDMANGGAAQQALYHRADGHREPRGEKRVTRLLALGLVHRSVLEPRQ
jgi:fructose-bisphosphate aldolase class I